MRIARLLFAFLVLAAAGAGATVVAVVWLRPKPPPAPPALDVPAEVDLGPQEFGTRIVGRFRVSNRGGRNLDLSRFATSCSCAGVEVEQDGQNRQVEELRVPPGGEVELSVRISVAVRPGSQQTVLVRFSSSDPERPDAAVKVVIPRITGGLSAEPAAIVFGETPLGRSATHIVRLYANGSASRQVHAARSLQPDRFTVRLLPPDPAATPGPDTDRLVATLEVTARTDRPSRLDGAVEIELNEATEQIQVFGEVVPPVVARPSAVVLPRMIGGRPGYSAQVGLVSRDGADMRVTVEAVPPGLTATARPDPDNPGQWLVDIAATAEGRAARTATVRVRAELRSGEPVVFDIPVTLYPADP